MCLNKLSSLSKPKAHVSIVRLLNGEVEGEDVLIRSAVCSPNSPYGLWGPKAALEEEEEEET